MSGNQVGQVEKRQLPHWQAHKEPLDTVTSRPLMMTNVSSCSLLTHTNTKVTASSPSTNKHAGLFSLSTFSWLDFRPQQNHGPLWEGPGSHLTKHPQTKSCHPYFAPEPSLSIMFHLWAWLEQSGGQMPFLPSFDWSPLSIIYSLRLPLTRVSKATRQGDG